MSVQQNPAPSANSLDPGSPQTQRGRGEIGPCKNATAYRTVSLCDPEGQKAMRRLARFLGIVSDSRSLIFHSKSGGPLLETNILNQELYPALQALGLEEAGMHAFRRGCNPAMGTCRSKPGCYSSADGSCLRCDDGTTLAKFLSNKSATNFP
jgi:hypothetical protein